MISEYPNFIIRVQENLEEGTKKFSKFIFNCEKSERKEVKKR
jgi:hypothetical protein